LPEGYQASIIFSFNCGNRLGKLTSAYLGAKRFIMSGFGTAVVASYMIPTPARKLKRLRVRGLPRPIYARLGTSDRSVLLQVFVSCEYDCPSEAHNQAVRAFYDEALARAKVPVIIDCGANIGLASLWYAAKFPEAKIIAVEPEPENFRILTMNAAGYSNITVVCGAISDRQARVSLHNVGDEPWAWETVESEAGDGLTYTIPSLMKGLPDLELMIVKIDIEGAK
jgi:FkbM family methyltransferase